MQESLSLEQDRSGEDRGGYEGCRFDAIFSAVALNCVADDWLLREP